MTTASSVAKRIIVPSAKSIASDDPDEDDHLDFFSIASRKSKKRRRKPKALYVAIILQATRTVILIRLFVIN